MKIKALHNGKIYEVIEQEDNFYTVYGPTLHIPIRLYKEHCIVVEDDRELTEII